VMEARLADGAAHQLAHVREDVLRRDALLPVTGGTADEILEGLLIQDAGIDVPLVQLAEGQERGQSHAAIAPFEGAVLQESEQESRRFFPEGRIRIFAEDRGLRPQHGVVQSVLRLHQAGMGVCSAELLRHRPVQLDDVHPGQIADLSL
jgi:hypothetical protein